MVELLVVDVVADRLEVAAVFAAVAAPDAAPDRVGFGILTDGFTRGFGTVTDARVEGVAAGALGRVFGAGDTLA